MSPLENAAQSLHRLIQDRYHDDAIAAMIHDEESGKVKIYYPATFRDDKIFEVVKLIVPDCHEWSVAGGNYIPELGKNINGHATVLTMDADDTQLEQIAEALDGLRERGALFPPGSPRRVRPKPSQGIA